jgi:hypothetical protein
VSIKTIPAQGAFKSDFFVAVNPEMRFIKGVVSHYDINFCKIYSIYLGNKMNDEQG